MKTVFEKGATWSAREREFLIKSSKGWRLAFLVVSAILAAGTAGHFLAPPRVIKEESVLRVNNATGVIEQLTKLDELKLTKGDVITDYWTQFYVEHREAYNYFPAQYNYDSVIALSSPEVAMEYDAEIDRLFKAYGKSVTAKVKIVSSVQQNDYTTTVRFQKSVKHKGSAKPKLTHWVATITYEYRAINKLEVNDRLNNKFGFWVTSYEVKEEAPV